MWHIFIHSENGVAVIHLPHPVLWRALRTVLWLIVLTRKGEKNEDSLVMKLLRSEQELKIQGI